MIICFSLVNPQRVQIIVFIGFKNLEIIFFATLKIKTYKARGIN